MQVTPIVLFIVVLVVVLFGLIVRINHAEHFAPQAYYRKKTAGAPVVFEFESLAPRPRKVLSRVDQAGAASSDDGS